MLLSALIEGRLVVRCMLESGQVAALQSATRSVEWAFHKVRRSPVTFESSAVTAGPKALSVLHYRRGFS